MHTESSAETATQTEYARHRGVTQPRISALVSAGRIPTDEAGRILVAEADAALDDSLDVTKNSADRLLAQDQQGGAAGGRQSEYWQNRARRERLEADKAELGLAEKAGRLVDVEAIEKSRYSTAQRVVNALMQMPARIAPIIAPQDPLRAEKVLLEEFRLALSDIANELDPPDAG